MRITSRLLPLTISSTWLVTVIGNASLPLRPFELIRRRNSRSACSTGISRACSSIRKSRSPARSKTTPRSAPIAVTSRLLCPTASRRLVLGSDESAANPWALTASIPSGPSSSGSTKEVAE